MKIGVMDGALAQPWERLFDAAAKIGFKGLNGEFAGIMNIQCSGMPREGLSLEICQKLTIYLSPQYVFTHIGR